MNKGIENDIRKKLEHLQVKVERLDNRVHIMYGEMQDWKNIALQQDEKLNKMRIIFDFLLEREK